MKRKFNIKKLVGVGKWVVLFIFLSILVYQNFNILKSLANISEFLPEIIGDVGTGFGRSSTSLKDIDNTLDDINKSIKKTNSWLDQIYSR